MIELNVKDYCQECPHFEPDVYKNVLTANWHSDYRTVISCQNKDICAMIQKHLENRMKQMKQMKRNSQEKQTS